MPALKISRKISDQRGSATSEFVFVSLLLMALTLALMQFAFALYARNVAIDSALDGAFHGALADRSVEEGVARAENSFRKALPGLSVSASADWISSADNPRVRIDVRATLPILVIWGPELVLATAEAPQQITPGG